MRRKQFESQLIAQAVGKTLFGTGKRSASDYAAPSGTSDARPANWKPSDPNAEVLSPDQALRFIGGSALIDPITATSSDDPSSDASS